MRVHPAGRDREAVHGPWPVLQGRIRRSASTPMARCRRRDLQAEHRVARPEPPSDSAYLSKVDYDLWLGPAPKRTFNRNRFHYNWHWHWDYGNGDTGNQGPHQFDIARWGLGRTSTRSRFARSAAISVMNPRRRRPTCRRRCSNTPTARSWSSGPAAGSPTPKAKWRSATCSTARGLGLDRR